jgi:glycosyltransferase involved in cell wall biosynthesis
VCTHGKRGGLIGRLAAHGKKPVVHTHHGLHFRGLKGKFFFPIERWLGRHWTAATIHVAEHQADLGKHRGLPGVAIPLGIDGDEVVRGVLQSRAARETLSVGNGEFLIGAVGRLDPVKRWHFLIDAIVGTDLRIIFLGDGPDRERLWRRAKRRGVVERVSFLGAWQHAWRLLRAFDMMALPSLEEGCPIVVLEAVTLGVPILCSNIPAHQEIFRTEHGLVNDKDWPAAVRRMADRTKGSLASFADLQGWQMPAYRTSTKNMVGAHEALYNRVAMAQRVSM